MAWVFFCKNKHCFIMDSEVKKLVILLLCQLSMLCALESLESDACKVFFMVLAINVRCDGCGTWLEADESKATKTFVGSS